MGDIAFAFAIEVKRIGYNIILQRQWSIAVTTKTYTQACWHCVCTAMTDARLLLVLITYESDFCLHHLHHKYYYCHHCDIYVPIF